jgi:hypothetical protein
LRWSTTAAAAAFGAAVGFYAASSNDPAHDNVGAGVPPPDATGPGLNLPNAPNGNALSIEFHPARFSERFGSPPPRDPSPEVSPEAVRERLAQLVASHADFVMEVGLDCSRYPCVAGMLVRAEHLEKVKGELLQTWPHADLGMASQDAENQVFAVTVLPLGRPTADAREATFVSRYRTTVEAEWSVRRTQLLEGRGWP